MAQFAIHPGPQQYILRYLGLAYGVAVFVMALGIWAYWAVFLGNLPPRSIPWIEPSVSVGPALATLPALFIDIGLLFLFGLQHSLMARSSVKDWITRFVAPDLERSTYVFAANLAFILLLVFWQPIPFVLWDAGDGIAEDIVWSIFVLGWVVLILSLAAIDSAELLGLRQAWAWFQNRPHESLPLKTRWLYSQIRHPLYLGVIIVVWAAPFMTVGHLLFAVGFTTYIVIGTYFEERDLLRSGGESYRAYQQAVPAFVPTFWKRPPKSVT